MKKDPSCLGMTDSVKLVHCLLITHLRIPPIFLFFIKNRLMENTSPTPEQDNTADSIAGYHDQIKQIHTEGMEQGVKKARNALFFIAGILLIWELIRYAAGGDSDEYSLAFTGVIVLIYVLLGLWTKKKPYTAIILGLVVFLLTWGLSVFSYAIVYGATGIAKALFGGIFIRIAVLVILLRSLSNAKELQQLKNEQSL